MSGPAFAMRISGFQATIFGAGQPAAHRAFPAAAHDGDVAAARLAARAWASEAMADRLATGPADSLLGPVGVLIEPYFDTEAPVA